MSVTAALEKIPVAVSAIPESEFVANCAALGVKKANRTLATLAASSEFLSSETLDLSPNYIGGLGLQALTSLLYKNKRLTTLNLARNGLSNESIVFFCRAFVDHPSLKSLNLSSNPISLPAGEALLDLVLRNKAIEEVNLDNTHIDDSVRRSIARNLNMRRQSNNASHAAVRKIPAPTSINANSTPYQRVVQEFEPKRERDAAVAAAARSKREDDAIVQLRELCNKQCARLRPPADPASMWTVVNIAVVDFPAIFHSEVNSIVNEVIPALNEAFAARKFYFNVLETPAQEEAGKGVDVKAEVVVADFLADVQKSGGIVIELIGDRIGCIEHVPALPTAANAKPQQPIQYTLHEAAVASDRLMLIACTRKPARQLAAPPAMVALLSDEPSLVHPDAQASAVKAAVAKARGVHHKLADFDIAVLQRSWDRHLAFQQTVNATTPDALHVKRYDAVYDSADLKGRIYLSHLDVFKSQLRTRLETIANGITAATGQIKDISVSRAKAFVQHAAKISTVRKQILGKMDLYTVTPPSRNMLLLYGGAGSSMTTTLGGYVYRCEKRPNYLVASHFCTLPILSDEPTDMRSMFFNLMRQLSSDTALLTHIQAEVDVVKIKEAFAETLQKISSSLDDGKVLIVAIDSLNDLDAPVLPCEALRTSDTGVDLWAPSMRLDGTTPTEDAQQTTRAAAASGTLDAVIGFIPVCLPRNVRIVGSAVAQSDVFVALEGRGRDSTEPMRLADLTANEVDLVVQAELQAIDVTLNETDLGTIGSKLGATSMDYLAFVIDGVKSLTEAPHYLSLSAMLETLPPTTELCCEQLLLLLERTFGAQLTKRALGIIHYARWGLAEMDLRDLLSQSVDAKKKTRFPSTELNKLLRLLRPVLQSYVPCDGEVTNNLLSVVKFRSRTFCSALVARYFSGTSDRRDIAFIHQQLAHHYRRITQAQGAHPLARTAFKELPYHAIQARLWTLLGETVFCLDYVSRCYELGLGYQLFRECIRAFNTLHEEASTKKQPSTHAALLDKMKQFVFFIRGHNVNLVQFPHLVAQIAIGMPATSQVHQDALQYFRERRNVPHITIANRTMAKLHREPVTDARFAPNGSRFATCSDDRSIRLVNLFGESVLHICQSASKLKLLRYSSTSRYLLAATEDRSTFVFDATSGQLVSKASGHAAVIRCAELSARGKFYATGSNDRTLKVWETETGALLATASHAHFSISASLAGGVAQVAPHPLAEDTFFTACDKKIGCWKLTHLRDALDEVLCIQGHHTLSLSTLIVAGDGAYAIACAQEPALENATARAAAASAPHTEENINIWTTSNGRHIAALSRGSNPNTPGPSFVAMAPSEKRLAAALIDGTIQIYNLDLRSYATDVDTTNAVASPTVVEPYLMVKGFNAHATPLASLLTFSHDSALLFAVGNLRQLKVWTIVGHSPEDEAAPLRVDTYAEYLSDQRITALCVSPNPQEEGGSIALGDATGRVLSLRLHTSEVESK